MSYFEILHFWQHLFYYQSLLVLFHNDLIGEQGMCFILKMGITLLEKSRFTHRNIVVNLLAK